MADDQRFSLIQGDDHEVMIPVKNQDGTPADLSQATVEWRHGVIPPGRSDAINKIARPEALTVKTLEVGLSLTTTTIKGVEYPAILVHLTHEETELLEAYTEYYFECKVVINNKTMTIATGVFTLRPELRKQ